MTYTIIGRCARTGRVGVAAATVSLGVGGAFRFTTRGDAIASQAYASRMNGHLMHVAMEAGTSAEDALAIPMAEDANIAYRQLMIMPKKGAPLAFTGDKCRPWCGHILGTNFVAAGNVLSGPLVVEAMAEAFRESENAELAERLLLALEAGRGAGGQTTLDGVALAERSASMRIVEGGENAGLLASDMRVDMHNSAIHELRKIFEVYKSYAPYSALREADPVNTPGMALFEADLLKNGGRFSERPSCYR